MIQRVFPYIGSKAVGAFKVLPHIPFDTEVYIEPFLGGGSITLILLQTRPTDGMRIICSDINEDLINFWVQLRDNPKGLVDKLESVASKLEDAIEEFKHSEDTIDRALYFYLCQHFKHVGAPTRDIHLEKVHRFNAMTKRFTLFPVSSLIQDVEFYHLSYETAIAKAERYNKAFIFADPPYRCDGVFQDSKYSDSDFIDYVSIENSLNSVNSKWVMSLGDDEYSRLLFSEYTIETLYIPRVNGRSEIYIRNF